MKTYLWLVVFSLTVSGLFAQGTPQVMAIDSSSNKPWTNLNFNNDPRTFRFVVTPDHTGAHRAGILQKGIDRINLLQPEFVVSIGDLIEGYTTDRHEIEDEWNEFNQSIRQLKMPYFYVIGNHDYTNQTMADSWQQKFGTPYYSFVYKNVLFLCLNSEDGATALEKPDFSAQQLAFIEKTLAENSKVDWTMVFMHQPLWLTPTATNWQRAEALLATRHHTVFTGHTHQYALYNRNQSDYFVLSTMGGINSLRGRKYGEFDHFLWVTMTPEGPEYANIMLDGVEDKSVQTAENLDRANAFNVNPPVRFKPYYYSVKPGKTNTWTIEFNNNTKEDQHFNVTLTAGKGLKPAISTISKNVVAGAKESMTMPVDISGKEGWTPMIANVSLDADKYTWDTKIQVQPYEKWYIDDIKSIKIDGDLGEWGGLRFSKHDSAGTAAFRFDVRSDNHFVYVGVEVTDRDIQAPSTYANLNQDGAFVVFDASPLEKSAFNLRDPDGMGRDWLFMIASPTANEFELGFKDQMPKGVTGKGRKTATGYAIEYAIPQALIQHFQGVDWQTIRFNIVVADLNTGDTGEPRRITWTPDWMENYPGSGMFFRKKE